MATTHIHPHHPLPAPAMHTGFSVPQSKSHVLAGVQDAYWSDDEADDAECPLCLEEMDISDLNFKPCVCGYQICRFCWHHIKENLNKRCPACRRIYTDEGVEFKPINKEDHKRLMQQKKQRERERKELDALGRRHLANVRVVQRNVVYVIGIGPRFAREELIPTLRSEDYFGKYGRISKILLVKRTSPGGGEPIVGLYITYHRREDAARAIAAVDGAASPSGGREVMRASYGTTKYCMAFLRGVNCNDQNCMNLHEWGDEKDCFTKEDLTTLKHTIKQTETRSRGTGKKVEEHDVGLPRGASWAAQKGVASGAQGSGISATSRQGRRGGSARHVRGSTSAQVSTGETRFIKAPDKKIVVSTTAKPPSQASSSRPATPASAMSAHRPGTPPDVKTMRTKRNSPYILHSPAHSTTADSDHWSSSQDIPSSAVPSTPAEVLESSMPPTPAVPPGLAVVPSGLSAPPGIPMPSRPPRVESASPQTPLLSSQTTYQMSNAARALIDDIKARREAVPSSIVNPSPFPDIDRTLQTLSGGDGVGFSFNLDPKLAHSGKDFENHLSNFEDEATSFQSNYMGSFPLQTVPPQHSGAFAPTGLSYTAYQDSPAFDSTSAHRPAVVSMERQSSNASSYIGSFNPFSDFSDDAIVSSPTQHNPSGDDIGRKVSRFGFARGRQGSANTPSPLHISLTTSANINENLSACGPADSYQGSQSWSLSAHQEYPYSHPNSAMGSPHVQLAQLHSVHSSQSPTLLQSYDSPETSHASLSEAQLREFIQSSRDRANVVGGPHNMKIEQNNLVRLPFNDPAVMSASLGAHDNSLAVYSDPPNLALPSTPAHNASISTTRLNETRKFSNTRSLSDGECICLTFKGREVSIPCFSAECAFSVVK
ncbi:hypothetical protein M378DRAFT_68976 [Amanita muscaria Koide BX008]|uniref:RING-type domain-containing protein n=1 Tax=Amanita muscaria (strain Koide BX008) TaxID=946122 RepID=A0A0C2T1G5_AMAMK|nr:hypothetical protein M378DRAFT_68976 [Amanita muscaria Koide BX008]